MYTLRVSLSLTTLMRRLILKPQEPVLKGPVLLWEAPPSESSPGAEDWAPTDAGYQTRPTSGDPLVFSIEKVAGGANPFAMGVTVGRVETNDIIVDDASVSRFHAWFQHDAKADKWFVCDAESKNGTFVGAERLTPNRKVEVMDGARIKFGDAAMTFFSPAGMLKELQRRSGR